MSRPSSLLSAVNVDLSNRNFDSFFSSLLLYLRGGKSTCLILEGPTDSKILKRFFDVKILCIPCIGRGNVTKIFRKLPKTYSNAFGIADIDYDQTPYLDFRLFYYDYNNMEMMIFSDDNIFVNPDCYNIYLPNRRLSQSDLIIIRNSVLCKLFPISVFRRINMGLIPERYRIAVSSVFPDISLCLSKTRDEISNEIKTNMLLLLNGLDLALLNRITSSYNADLSNKSINLYDITQGHDFVELFGRKIGIISDDLLYDVLSKTYTFDLFMKTNLYSNLKKFAILQTIKMFKN